MAQKAPTGEDERGDLAEDIDEVQLDNFDMAYNY